MFGMFKTADRLDSMNRSLAESFGRVKQDTEMLYRWVNFLHEQNKEFASENAALRRLVEDQKRELSDLKNIVAHVPKTPAEIKALVDAHYSFEPVIDRIRKIEHKMDLLELRKERRPVEIPVSVEKEPTALQEKMMRKLARNSKEYIKNLVLSLVHKYTRMGALQLREIIVEEQGLCSKSSFYRILEEMESENSLQVVSDGKHTIYVATAQSHA